MASTILKQGLHTMLLLKFGEINLMISKAMYGLLAVFYMKWPLLRHHFKLKTWTICSKRWSKGLIKKFPAFSQVTFIIWSGPCWPLTQLRDPPFTKFSRCLVSYLGWKKCSLKTPLRISRFNHKIQQIRNPLILQGFFSRETAPNRVDSSYLLSEIQRILSSWKTNSQSLILNLKW